MNDAYVGLMSGTSMDGIDAVIASFGDRSIQIHATHSERYPPRLREQLRAATQLPLSEPVDPDDQLHRQVGECFRDATVNIIKHSGYDASRIRAIGSHGQTLRHEPNIDKPYSLQVGDPTLIADATGIATVADFRTADIEAGGQGAPLVPPFHRWLFASANESRVVLNIGGIANITLLPADGNEVTGFDTGPGNGLMDAWIHQHEQRDFDESGKWASGGNVIEPLLAAMLDDPYFRKATPKSTGFEYFNLNWLNAFDLGAFATQDVQATLCELTARSISDAIGDERVDHIFVCGGGAYNRELMRRLDRNNSETKLSTTDAIGLHPAWVEATAFAWLAMRNVHGLPGNLPSVTGASHALVLGELHSP